MTSDLIRLVVVLVLGLAAFGLIRTALLIPVAGVVAVLLRTAVNFSWVTSAAVATAAVFWLVLLASFMKKPRGIPIALAVIGGPALCISRFACDSSWVVAIVDSMYISLALPAAVLGLLVRSGVMKRLASPSRTAATFTPRATSYSSYSSHAPVSYGRSELRTGGR